MNILISQLSKEDNIPFNLLLLADPSREMIDHYLADSHVFVASCSKKIVGVMVLKVSKNHSEIMNIAVEEEFQENGIGTLLINHAKVFIKKVGVKSLIIGTADSSLKQLTFYQKCGSKECGKVVDFFTQNYESPIFENGLQAKDMIKLEWIVR